MIHTRPDYAALFAEATSQQGYFTNAQAEAHGVSRALLARHAQTGRFIRRRRGLYRFRDFPSSPREEVMAAWLAVGKDAAVVSHGSALDLLDLSDVIPHGIHITVPRSKRNLPDIPGVVIHTTTRPLEPRDVTFRDGIRLTSATRTILDSATIGTAPDQVELAIQQAVARALTTPRRLKEAALHRSHRVQLLVQNALMLEET